MNHTDAIQVLDVIESSGLEQSTIATLKERFLPFYEQVEAWKARAETLKVTDVSQVREMKMAREARLALRAIRVDADKTRKALKEDSIRYGKAIQGVYNVIEYLIKPIEEHLQEQEDFAKIQEERRIAALRASRLEALEPYDGFVAPDVLNAIDTCPEQVFEHILATAKADKAAWEEAERKAEQERIAKEKAEAEERQRIIEENERLRKEAAAREKKIAEERRKAEQARIILVEQARKEREAREALEEQARKAEEKARAEQARKEEEARKAQAAPDREKLAAWILQIYEVAYNAPLVKTEIGVKVKDHIEKNVQQVAEEIRKYLYSKM